MKRKNGREAATHPPRRGVHRPAARRVRWPLRALAVAACLAVTAATAAAQQRPTKGEPAPRGWPASQSSRASQPTGDLLAASTALPMVAHADTVTESEPNDTPQQANLVPLNSIVRGTMDGEWDFDFFAIDIPGPIILDLEVFASRGGSSLDSYLYLIAPDGNTVLRSNDDHEGLDSRIRYRITTPGRYLAAIFDLGGRSGPAYWYHLGVTALPPPDPGPGDPITARAPGLGFAAQLSAGRSGELYVADFMGRLLRISPTWEVTQITQLDGLRGVAVDGTGDLLVTIDYPGQLRRITATGSEVVASGLDYAGFVTLAPDGDIYVVDGGSVRRYGPTGTPRPTIPGGTVSPFFIAVSPDGVLHATNFGSAVHRWSAGRWEVAATVPGVALLGMAFDEEGYLYVGTDQDGLLLLDLTNGTHSTFSHDSDGAISLAFGRAADGSMTSRLFGLHMGSNDPARIGVLEEFNPAGVAHAGLRVGRDHLRVATASLRAGVMGASYGDTLSVESAAAAVWSIEGGALPAGLTLEGETGIVSGIPAASGSFNVSVRVESDGMVGFRRIPLSVTRPTVVVADAANHLLGVAGLLDEDLLRYLDLQGNANGRFDIGDFRVFIRTNNVSAALLPAQFQNLASPESPE